MVRDNGAREHRNARLQIGVAWFFDQPLYELDSFQEFSRIVCPCVAQDADELGDVIVCAVGNRVAADRLLNSMLQAIEKPLKAAG